jgi:flavin reductase
MSHTEDLRTSFICGMARAATTVSVVTTDGPAGRFGLTVSAMASVSADGPAPTLLICVHQSSPAAAALLSNGYFAVNVLDEAQHPVSDRFAGRGLARGEDRFANVEWVPGDSGVPRLTGARAIFECRVMSSSLVGTHHVFIGEVLAVDADDRSAAPLVYSGRSYCRLQPLAA